MDSRKVSRLLLKDGHDRMKWVSSSILFGHSLQKRFSLGVCGFVWRPDSIARQWSQFTQSQFTQSQFRNYSPIESILYHGKLLLISNRIL